MADESDGAAAKTLREDPDGATSAPSSEDEEEGFTFASATHPPGGGAFGVIGQVYPVFGRPRSPPPFQEEEGEGTATVRVPLRQLLLADRGSSSPSSQEQPDTTEDDRAEGDGELEGVPAETYCLWSPGTSPSPSPSRCPKSGSTGSVLRWRQRLQVGRSHSDGKEKFVFLQDTPAGSSPGRNGGTGESLPGGLSYYGRGRGSGRSSTTFLPYKQDLVGFFANAGALRRSYHPF